VTEQPPRPAQVLVWSDAAVSEIEPDRFTPLHENSMSARLVKIISLAYDQIWYGHLLGETVLVKPINQEKYCLVARDDQQNLVEDAEHQVYRRDCETLFVEGQAVDLSEQANRAEKNT